MVFLKFGRDFLIFLLNRVVDSWFMIFYGNWFGHFINKQTIVEKGEYCAMKQPVM